KGRSPGQMPGGSLNCFQLGRGVSSPIPLAGVGDITRREMSLEVVATITACVVPMGVARGFAGHGQIYALCCQQSSNAIRTITSGIGGNILHRVSDVVGIHHSRLNGGHASLSSLLDSGHGSSLVDGLDSGIVGQGDGTVQSA